MNFRVPKLSAYIAYSLAILLIGPAVARADGWHRPGDVPAAENVATQEGPSLQPTRSTAPRATNPRRTDRAPQPFDPPPAIARLSENRDDDQWAEQALARRNAQPAQPTRPGVARVSYQAEATGRRQIPPSAFSRAAYYQPEAITSDLLGAPDSEPGEELPSPQRREDLPPINTDHLLKGYSYGDIYFHDQGDLGHGFNLMTGDCDSCSSCGPGAGHGSCNACGPGGGCGWKSWLQDMTLFGGTQGFKGPPDLGRNGNFGFHYGLNYGAPIWLARRIGYQVGGQVVQSNLSGSNVLEPTSASRTQFFITTGLFQRAVEWAPLQWGIAYDWLSDNYYVNMQFGKLRGELSYVTGTGDEFGFWTSLNVMDDSKYVVVDNQTEEFSWKSADLYAFFWRRHFCGGGVLRAWGGFSGNADGLVGGEFRAPLSDRFAIEGNSNYLIPATGVSSGALRESWALSLNLVYYVGGGASSADCSPWQPLFNVADNSIFMYTAPR